ncbi:MAG: phosphatase PAP2 family protein, partial [Myxococcota bacterium]
MWAALGTDAATLALGALVLVWGVWRRRWAWLLGAALAVSVADPLVARVLKPAFDRPRPCHVMHVETAQPCGSGRAMPSGHAANSAALAAATRSPPLAGAAVLIGISRVVLGQHWPSDVVVGWLVG